jgi:hypothetical protein
VYYPIVNLGLCNLLVLLVLILAHQIRTAPINTTYRAALPTNISKSTGHKRALKSPNAIAMGSPTTGSQHNSAHQTP